MFTGEGPFHSEEGRALLGELVDTDAAGDLLARALRGALDPQADEEDVKAGVDAACAVAVLRGAPTTVVHEAVAWLQTHASMNVDDLVEPARRVLDRVMSEESASWPWESEEARESTLAQLSPYREALGR